MSTHPKTTTGPGHEPGGQTEALYWKHKWLNTMALTITNIKVLESQLGAWVIQQDLTIQSEHHGVFVHINHAAHDITCLPRTPIVFIALVPPLGLWEVEETTIEDQQQKDDLSWNYQSRARQGIKGCVRSLYPYCVHRKRYYRQTRCYFILSSWSNCMYYGYGLFFYNITCTVKKEKKNERKKTFLMFAFLTIKSPFLMLLKQNEILETSRFHCNIIKASNHILKKYSEGICENEQAPNQTWIPAHL